MKHPLSMPRHDLTTLMGLICCFALTTAAENAPLPAAEADAAATAPPPPPKWETTAGLGVSVTDGNSDTLLFTVNALTLRKWDHSEFSAGVDGGYGENDNERNVGFVKGYAQYNYLFTERWYAFGRVEALHDAVADIRYRIPLSVGVGYYFIKNDRMTLSAEAGPGYVFEKVGNDERDYPTIRFAEKFTYKISDRARIWQSFEYQPDLGDWGNYFLTGELGIGADVTKQIELRVVLQDWYVSNPAPDREGNDLKLVAGVNYKFQ
jgi:putative salt-induced outer membrane protein YdiY